MPRKEQPPGTARVGSRGSDIAAPPVSDSLPFPLCSSLAAPSSHHNSPLWPYEGRRRQGSRSEAHFSAVLQFRRNIILAYPERFAQCLPLRHFRDDTRCCNRRSAPERLELISFSRSSFTFIMIVIMSPHTGLPTSPTPSGRSIVPRFRGFLKWSITRSEWATILPPLIEGITELRSAPYDNGPAITWPS